jgi:hypothetical protein
MPTPVGIIADRHPNDGYRRICVAAGRANKVRSAI